MNSSCYQYPHSSHPTVAGFEIPAPNNFPLIICLSPLYCHRKKCNPRNKSNAVLKTTVSSCPCPCLLEVLSHPHTWQLLPPLAPGAQGGQLTPCCKAGNAPKPSAAEAYFPINPFTQFHGNPLFSLGTTPSTSFP